MATGNLSAPLERRGGRFPAFACATGMAVRRNGGGQTIQAYKRLTKRAEAIIADAYLVGTNTRRVRRVLAGLFGGKGGKDAVSRAWRKVKTD